jgi:hypothetical protein
VAVCWEVFEFRFGLFEPRNYVLDSITDILMGIAGSCLAYLHVTRLVRLHNR